MTRLTGPSRRVPFVLAAALLVSSATYAGPITIVGAPQKGALPTMITAFANQAGTDVLPAGGTDYYVFTLFDTGAQRIYADPGAVASLGLTDGMVTDVRINGLAAIDPVTLFAPIYAGQAQADVQNIPVSAGVPAPDVTLIGGPVTNAVKAQIDYTTTITRGPYAYLGGGSISGPDITFFASSATPAFDAGITLAMQPFGSLSATDPGKGQRYWMYDVGFNEGANSIASPAFGDLSASGRRFLYDTGTNVTLLRDSLATPLGLTGPPDFTMSMPGLTDPGPLNGYLVDSLTMTGVGGTFTVLNAPVLVTVDVLGGSADAIIGSNLFAQSTLLFDGPAATLSIEGQAEVIPEPSTLMLLGIGIVALTRRFRS